MTGDRGADPRLRSPAVARNREPILGVLQDRLPARGTVLEVASGTGETIAFLAHHLPRLAWQPSERDPAMLASVEGWRRQPGLRSEEMPNLRSPLTLDVSDPGWPQQALTAVPFPVALVAINLLHIVHWSVAELLFSGAAELLMPGRMLYLYGPFMVDGKHTSPGNAAFDKTLRDEDPDRGVRELQNVRALGEAQRFELEEVVEMPANNLSLIFRRQ